MRRSQPSPYDLIAAKHPQFPRAFAARVARNDTLDDLAFWIRSQYGVQVSRETIRKWKSRRINNGS